MPVAVTCVATDGNLGLFIPAYSDGHNLGSSFFGHVHRFEWTSNDSEEAEPKLGAPPILFSVKQESEMKASKPKRPKKPSLKSILAEM